MLEIFILIFIGGGGAVTNVRMILCSCEKLLKLKWDTPLKLYYFLSIMLMFPQTASSHI